ncbi:MAG TPA: HEAT repeat domain-containing protein, partial [Isosphaeraceae bacterium]|nr:HEAT repeat domain-containing protein [Isosphaeraceae bacterium]
MFLVIALLAGLGSCVDVSAQVGGKPVQYWIDALRGSDPPSRQAAARALGILGPDAKPAVPALARAASDADSSVRSSAIRALGAIGPEAKEAVPALVRAASDADKSVRLSAIRALGAIGPGAREAIPVLVRAASDADTSVCYYGIAALAGIGRPAVPQLIQLLGSPRDDVSDWAVWYLGTIGPDASDAVPALIREYEARRKSPSYPRHQLWTIQTLGRIGPGAKEAVPLVAEALRAHLGEDRVATEEGWHPLSQVAAWALTRLEVSPVAILSVEAVGGDYGRSSAAIDLLGALGARGRPAIPELLGVMNKRGNDDRWVLAAGALSQIDPANESYTRVLIEAIRDHEIAAIEALRRLGPRARTALPSILSALVKDDKDYTEDNPPMSRAWMIRSLVWIDPDGQDIVPALIRALRNEDWEVWSYAADGLGLVGGHSREAVLALAQELKADAEGKLPDELGWDIVECCAIALARIGERAEPAVPALVQLLASKSQQRRVAAVIALGGIGPAAKAATPALIRALKDESGDVRIRAPVALARIGPGAKAAVPSLVAVLGADGVKRVGADEGSHYLAILALIRIDPTTGRSAARRFLDANPDLKLYTRADVSIALGVKSPESAWRVRGMPAALRRHLSPYPWISPSDYVRLPWPNQERVEGTIDMLALFGPEADEATPVLQEL